MKSIVDFINEYEQQKQINMPAHLCSTDRDNVVAAMLEDLNARKAQFLHGALGLTLCKTCKREIRRCIC